MTYDSRTRQLRLHGGFSGSLTVEPDLAQQAGEWQGAQTLPCVILTFDEENKSTSVLTDIVLTEPLESKSEPS